MREAKTPIAVTGRLRLPPGHKEFNVGDFLVSMPLLLEPRGGVEYGFMPGKKVALGFLFAASAENLTNVKLLGYTLAFDPSKRAGKATFTAGPRNAPVQAPPQAATGPAVPVSSATTVFEMIPPPPKEFGGIGAMGNRRGGVSAVAFSPDGQRVLGAGGSSEKLGGDTHYEGVIGLWNLRTGKQVPLWTTKEPIDFKNRSPIFAAAAFTADGYGGFSTPTVDFSRDGKRAVSTTDGRLLRVWNLERFEELRRFNAALGEGVVLAADGRHALLWGGRSGLDRDLHLWDLNTGREARLLRGHSGRVGCAAFSLDGRLAVSGGHALEMSPRAPPAAPDFAVILWDVNGGRELRRFPGHTAPVHAVAFSPDGRCILSASGPTKPGQAGPGRAGLPAKGTFKISG